MLIRGGELDGARILGPRTIAWMTRNHLPGGGELSELSQGLFSEVALAGMGFGLGFSVLQDPAKAGVPCSPGSFAWGGAASTIFWIDPSEDLIAIFLTQFFPSQTFNFRGQLQSIVYPAILD
jgi:CubicO group peptidase (beta-lactamase class C family)